MTDGLDGLIDELTADDLADLLRPVATRLVDYDDDLLSKDVVLAKVLIFYVMAWLEQMTPAQRRAELPHLALHAAGLGAIIRPRIVREEGS